MKDILQRIEESSPIDDGWHDLRCRLTDCAKEITSLRNQLAECQKDAERLELLEETLDKVNNWCKAYPIEICDEPNFEEVKEKLGSTLLTQVSFSNMRHITNGISKIIDQAMSEKG
jgi:DNA repair ATPase RecN